MKKVKIMLLSLALFAVVGGALAFKAKFQDTFCTTDAYFKAGVGYYCSYTFGTPVQTTTTTCGSALVSRIKLDPDPNAITKVCTTTSFQGGCNTWCDDQTSTLGN